MDSRASSDGTTLEAMISLDFPFPESSVALTKQ